MRRKFAYWTITRMVERLNREGVPIKASTFRNLENAGVFVSPRTFGGWRRYSDREADLIIATIKEYYGKGKKTL